MNPEILALLELAVPARSAVLADGRRVFVKRRHDAPADFFGAEARGLSALAAVGALRTPHVYGIAPHGIVIEDLGSGRPSQSDWEAAGRGLAMLHAGTAARFGFDTNGYCGDSPQDNTPDDNGHRFFVERRLMPQARRARTSGLLDAGDLQRIDQLSVRLDELLPVAPPVLIHGDLWTGNLHACAGGELALIDGGAVHHGWRDCDLAMLILFGEPPRAFFAAYEAESGIGAEWRQRAPLLNLYHLLNHLTLFGAGYLGGVRDVLSRYR